MLQEAVTPPQGVDDHEAFQLELRGFLSELKFPQMDVIEGLGLTFLYSFRNRLLVLDFLVSELMATRLLLLRQSKEQVMETSDSEVSEWVVDMVAHTRVVRLMLGFLKSKYGDNAEDSQIR